MIEGLPKVRGKYIEDARMADLTWFRVGGCADVLFQPADTDDLAGFFADKPNDLPVTVVGVGSNLLVRDGGIGGVVVRLARGFTDIAIDNLQVTAGAAVLDVMVAKAAQKAGIGGLEFFRGIPGTIGGALRMNAGSYGSETKDVFVSCRGVTFDGEIVDYSHDDMSFTYRHSGVSENVIFTEGVFEGRREDPEKILARMAQITDSREASQPVRSRTGGSTFKNPDPSISDGRKAWQLIDAAGCRGLKVGGAKVSEQHCNFLINEGEATASDIETLGETVRVRVEEETRVALQWEIQRVGRGSNEGTGQ